MSIGMMNTWIDLQVKRIVKDEEGFSTVEFSTVNTVRAYREGRHGSEKWSNRASFTDATDLFRFRALPHTEVTTDMTMDTERTAIITIGGEEYSLVLTTRATKQIAGRYGGLENLGDKLMKSENFELAIGEIVWLITLLANQSILIHNLRNRDNKRELLTEENVELLTSPVDLASYKDAITEALYKGTKRNIISEDDPKNAAVG